MLQSSRRLRAVTASAIAALAALALGGAQLGSASAAADTTPPTLNLPVRASFVPLSTISATGVDPWEGWPTETSVQMRTQWTGRDTSGICGYSTARHHDEYYPDEVPWSPWSNAESITLGVSDYDDQEGGGMDKLWGLEVRARDCAGNVAQKFVAFAPIVFQQDGRSYSYGDLEVSTNGTWRTSRCACWAAGTALSTSAKGARYNIDVPLRGDAVGTTPVALVMERAPDRGKARVLVDGVRVATIDTRAPRKVHRSIVWVGRLNPGAHTLSVVNVGTKGRSRIDVDALAVSPGFSVDASYR